MLRLYEKTAYIFSHLHVRLQFIYELRSNVITCIWDGGPNMEEHDTSRFHLEFKII